MKSSPTSFLITLFLLMFIRVVHSRNCDSVSQNSKHKQRVCCFCQNPTHLLRNKNSAQKNKTCPLFSKRVPSTKTIHTDITWCLLADHHRDKYKTVPSKVLIYVLVWWGHATYSNDSEHQYPKKKNNKKSTYLMYILSKFTKFTMYCKYNEKPYTDPKL